MPIKSLIRTIPDYPVAGVMFRDITTLLHDARGFRKAVDELVQPYAGARVDKVAGIEARGFIVGGAVAHQLSVGFVPVRKQGKLPWETIGFDYDLEYGTDRVEIHTDAIATGEAILLVDDLIATGGTARGGDQAHPRGRRHGGGLGIRGRAPRPRRPQAHRGPRDRGPQPVHLRGRLGR